MDSGKSNRRPDMIDYQGLKNKYKMVVKNYPKAKSHLKTGHDELKTAQSGTVYKYSENRPNGTPSVHGSYGVTKAPVIRQNSRQRRKNVLQKQSHRDYVGQSGNYGAWDSISDGTRSDEVIGSKLVQPSS